MNPYTLLAKQAIESYIKEGKTISPPKNLPGNFYTQKSGLFVTIKNKGQLRGCIGTYLPTKENIAEEIISNAISAATKDYRFPSITKEELNQLSYTVYILHQPEPIESLKELNPKIYGLIVKTIEAPKEPLQDPTEQVPEDLIFNGHLPYKCGLLLPDLEEVETAEKQFLICCQKGGIDPEREKVVMFRFKVDKYD